MFIDQLRSIRANLNEVANSDNQFHMKLVGPQPESPCNDKVVPPETVASIVEDIKLLSERLIKASNTRHELVGEFSPAPRTAGVVPRGFNS